MSARFCRYCGASISAGAQFCTRCGKSLSGTPRTDPNPTQDLRFGQIGDSLQKDSSSVPEWNTYYPSLSDASAEQRDFYTFWKNNLEKGVALDVGGNLSYLFVYAYDAIYHFVENRDIHQLKARFELLKQGYSNYDKISYLEDWLADAWIYVENYDEAWLILREKAGLSIDDILSIRARCSDTTIDGNELLRVIGYKVSTKSGRERREKAANLLTTFLTDFHQKNGMNFVAHFCKQFNLTNLTSEDIDKLETYFPDDEEFLRLLTWNGKTQSAVQYQHKTRLICSLACHSLSVR